MRSRSLRILLIGIFSLWFGIIVPGHERGAIRVAGANTNATGDASCHTVAKSTCDHCPTQSSHSSQSSDQPVKAPADPSQHCAICKFIGLLDAPIVIQFELPTVELMGMLDPPALRSIAALSVLSIDRGRGPPSLFI